MYYQLLKRPYQVQSFKIFNECVYSISHLKTDDGESKVRDDLKKLAGLHKRGFLAHRSDRRERR
jgi:hypothetical protein